MNQLIDQIIGCFPAHLLVCLSDIWNNWNAKVRYRQESVLLYLLYSHFSSFRNTTDLTLKLHIVINTPISVTVFQMVAFRVKSTWSHGVEEFLKT
jgi:hypothetical protein